jgi:hypothetical protein
MDENYRNRLTIPHEWNREIKTDNVKWKFSAQNAKTREFKFTPTTVGTIKLEIDAGDALSVVLTDTVGGARIDTIVSGNRLKESKIVLTINVIEGGILHFKNKIAPDTSYYYIFICSPSPNESNKGLGLMPGKLSIVYNNSPITATHEMGHNLGLQHTFENDKDSNSGVCRVDKRILPQGYTKNIMDYTGKPDLRRYFFLYQIDQLKNK